MRFSSDSSIDVTVNNAAQTLTLCEGGCQQPIKGAQGEVCRGTRTETPVFHLSDDAPEVVLFEAPEPLFSSPVARLDYPPRICMLGKTYQLMAVSYLARPLTVHGSGHYVCIFKTEQGWLSYNGLKRKSKPAFLRRTKGPRDNLLRDLDPCLLTCMAS